jgi:hypothetical protein
MAGGVTLTLTITRITKWPVAVLYKMHLEANITRDFPR